MKKVGIFYGPVDGSTEKVARKIAELIGSENCDLLPVRDASIGDLDNYTNVVFGIATIGNETWNSEPLKSGWFTFMAELEGADLNNKTIALYGLGDHIRYADHFVDAMGELNSLVSKKGIVTIGHVSAADYTYRESKALEGDTFVGLPVDEEFEQSLTDQRLISWVNELKNSFK